MLKKLAFPLSIAALGLALLFSNLWASSQSGTTDWAPGACIWGGSLTKTWPNKPEECKGNSYLSAELLVLAPPGSTVLITATVKGLNFNDGPEQQYKGEREIEFYFDLTGERLVLTDPQMYTNTIGIAGGTSIITFTGVMGNNGRAVLRADSSNELCSNCQGGYRGDSVVLQSRYEILIPPSTETPVPPTVTITPTTITTPTTTVTPTTVVTPIVTPVPPTATPVPPTETPAIPTTTPVGQPQYCALGDLVWSDLNADGIQQPGEPGIYNAKIDVVIGPTLGSAPLPPSAIAIAAAYRSTTTDASGRYWVGGLDCNLNYYVRVTMGNAVFTVRYVGEDPSMDSNADTEGGSELVTTFTEGIAFEDPTIDFGIIPPAAEPERPEPNIGEPAFFGYLYLPLVSN